MLYCCSLKVFYTYFFQISSQILYGSLCNAITYLWLNGCHKPVTKDICFMVTYIIDVILLFTKSVLYVFLPNIQSNFVWFTLQCDYISVVKWVSQTNYKRYMFHGDVHANCNLRAFFPQKPSKNWITFC